MISKILAVAAIRLLLVATLHTFGALGRDRYGFLPLMINSLECCLAYPQ